MRYKNEIDMKKTTILFSVFALLLIATNACTHSQKDDFIVIPLQVGENARVQFGALQIDRILLLYHDPPEAEHLANITLMLWFRIGNSDRERFIQFSYHYNERWAHRNSRPRALGNYNLTMKVDEDGIRLVIERLDFGKEFYIGGTVVIENLSISFRYEGHSHGWRYPGAQQTTFGYYRMVLSEGSKRQEFNFTVCCCRSFGYVEWRNYRIDISDNLKFKVTKTSRRYNPRFQRFRQSARNVYSRFAETIAFFVSHNNRNETFEIHATDVRWAADDIATVKAKNENGVVIAEAAFENNGFVLHLPNHLPSSILFSLVESAEAAGAHNTRIRRNVLHTAIVYLAAYDKESNRIGEFSFFGSREHRGVSVGWFYASRNTTIRGFEKVGEWGYEDMNWRLRRGWNAIYSDSCNRRENVIISTTRKPSGMIFYWEFRAWRYIQDDEVDVEYDFSLPPRTPTSPSFYD